MARLEFFFDVVCPYACLAASKIEALAQHHGAELALRPVLLGGIYQQVNNQDNPRTDWPRNKQLMTWRDLMRQAELFGITLNIPPEHPRRTVEAMRLLASAPPERLAPLMHALFRAYWTENEDISDREVLARIAARHEVDPAGMDNPHAKEALRATTEEAVQRGAFGVPTFMLGERMWWGADRMHFVESALGGSPASYQPEPGKAARLEVFHDFSSPFSYLGCTQIARIAREHGAELHWRPMLLGALFRNIGTPMMPALAVNEHRRVWGAQDLEQWAAHWGVPFRFTSHFPLRTVLALRCSLVAPQLVPAFYDAAWARDQDLGDEAVVRETIAAQGLDADAVVAEATSQPVKDAVRANTERAEALGACGAPTFVINEQVVIWGQDRLEMVRRALDGWVPEVDHGSPVRADV